MTIGSNIKRIREEQGMTQKDLANKCGIIYQTIGKYERDILKPKLDTLDKIAKALGVSLFDLMGDDFLLYQTSTLEEKKAIDKVNNIIEDYGLSNLFELLKEIDGIEFDLSFLPTDENEEFGFKIKDHKNKFGIGLSLEELRQINKECEQAYKECLKLKIYEMYFKKRVLPFNNRPKITLFFIAPPSITPVNKTNRRATE